MAGPVRRLASYSTYSAAGGRVMARPDAAGAQRDFWNGVLELSEVEVKAGSEQDQRP